MTQNIVTSNQNIMWVSLPSFNGCHIGWKWHSNCANSDSSVMFHLQLLLLLSSSPQYPSMTLKLGHTDKSLALLLKGKHTTMAELANKPLLPQCQQQ